MILLLLIRSLLAQVAYAAPVPTDINQGPEPICKELGKYRTTKDIVWNCLLTVFACTWVAIHLNIPAPTEGMWAINRRRIKTMFGALLLPEVLILFAARQWAGARELAKRDEFKDLGWTKTHGFFAQMGGFMLYDGEECHTLSPEELCQQLKAHELESPCISEKEIQDRSKGDAISKGVVLLQTSWFLTQCIARGVQGLAITEIEIATLAYALLNVFTYYLWWHKPQNVECAFRIYLKKPQTTTPDASLEGEVVKQGQITDSEVGSEAARNPSDVNTGNEPLPAQSLALSSSIPKTIANFITNLLRRLADTVHQFPRAITKFFTGLLHRLADAVRQFPRTRGDFCAVGWWCLAFFPKATQSLMEVSFKWAESTAGDDEVRPGSKKVPTWYAIESSDTSDIWICGLFLLIGCAFGAVHCIAWSFHFPSDLEMIIWRTSSVVIVGCPLSIILCISLLLAVSEYFPDAIDAGAAIIWFMFCIGAALCAVARTMLLVLPFLALRDIPPDAYKTVQWATFIPHLG